MSITATTQPSRREIIGHPTTRIIFASAAFVLSGLFTRFIRTPYYEKLSRDVTNPAQKAHFEVTVNKLVLREVLIVAFAAGLITYYVMRFAATPQPLQRGTTPLPLHRRIVGHLTTRIICSLVAFIATAFFIRLDRAPYYERLSRDVTNPAQRARFEVTTNDMLLQEAFSGAIAAFCFIYCGMYFMGWVARQVWQYVDRQTHQN